MDVAIKKVSERNGAERFVLVNVKSREVVTVNDVSEKSLRRYFQQQGVSDKVLASCFEVARKKYSEMQRAASEPVDDASETMEDDDLLFELGLDDD